jgi:CelD/BcsL family acetyltransferase involved in cellulose biosynthesis
MTMAAAIESRTAEEQLRRLTPRITTVDITSDLTQAEPAWRHLEAAPFSTPFQRYEFLATWQHHIGEAERVEPLIVTAYDVERRPLLLLPLGQRSRHGVRIASFLGGKHATFNLALWDREFAPRASAGDLDTLLTHLRDKSATDVLALTQQPRRWREWRNPMAAWPHQESVNGCPLLSMPPGAPPTDLISGSFRKRLRAKERKLQGLAGYRYHVARDDADVERLLAWFFRIKPLRMAEQKLPDVFAEPHVRDFVHDACHARLSGGDRTVQIHALECDAEVLALFAGVADGERFSMMFNTYTMSEHARFSPGLILMRDIVDHFAALDYRAIDLGVGSDDYKRLFCKQDEPIFDSFIPLTSRGKVAAAALSNLNRGKRMIKHNPALLQLAQRLRAAFH